ncbi:MAG: mitochondrial fission ELM1 family protein [Pseudomonadota bacterium]
MTEKQAHHEENITALIITDGKAGDLAQCRGVAKSLGAATREISIAPGLISRTLGLKGPDGPFDRTINALSKPPHIILASGRRTVPYLRHLKAKWRNGTMTVFLKDPRTGTATADLIWVPSHDRLRGDNVIVTDTAPHGLQKGALELAAAEFQARMQDFPRPWLGVLVGGVSKRVQYEDQTRAALALAVKRASDGAGSVLITPSRRTSPSVIAQLQGLHPNLWIWDGTGPNPYTGILGASDALFVTGDSHNMVSEALVSGRQVMVFRPQGLPPKLERFLNALNEKGFIADPKPMDANYRQAPIDATSEIASRLVSALSERGF